MCFSLGCEESFVAFPRLEITQLLSWRVIGFGAEVRSEHVLRSELPEFRRGAEILGGVA